VLASREAFFFRRRDDATVNDKGSRRIVKYCVHT
jgi:hypothetical protein